MHIMIICDSQLRIDVLENGISLHFVVSVNRCCIHNNFHLRVNAVIPGPIEITFKCLMILPEGNIYITSVITQEMVATWVSCSLLGRCCHLGCAFVTTSIQPVQHNPCYTISWVIANYYTQCIVIYWANIHTCRHFIRYFFWTCTCMHTYTEGIKYYIAMARSLAD